MPEERLRSIAPVLFRTFLPSSLAAFAAAARAVKAARSTQPDRNETIPPSPTRPFQRNEPSQDGRTMRPLRCPRLNRAGSSSSPTTTRSNRTTRRPVPRTVHPQLPLPRPASSRSQAINSSRHRARSIGTPKPSTALRATRSFVVPAERHRRAPAVRPRRRTSREQRPTQRRSVATINRPFRRNGNRASARPD